MANVLRIGGILGFFVTMIGLYKTPAHIPAMVVCGIITVLGFVAEKEEGSGYCE